MSAAYRYDDDLRDEPELWDYFDAMSHDEIVALDVADERAEMIDSMSDYLDWLDARDAEPPRMVDVAIRAGVL